ncbi:hypothetical protein CANARDRAFT_26732 [[Candida] arabinofermentans NRRL YB-2248]|uniref:P-type Na(+) transporter n=1 Tax=[Candida] arabinofermentans NRRL YB-2248 TaxID=983967 RepID=A0A1E4T6E1_9ASCO|nr:hypothetical protein CANARDRAFT_26732 [[Candida] arabinofermentans NRRL YB-2248]
MSYKREEKSEAIETDIITRNTTNSTLYGDPGTNSYLITIPRCAEVYETDVQQGLSSSLIESLVFKYGKNNLGDETSISILKILLHQVCNAMIIVLIISLIISFAIKDWITGGVITAIVCLNVAIGSQQEFQAEQTMGSLKTLSSPSAHVIRDGKVVTIPAENVVPGDIVMVKVGDTIPCDIRLIESTNFETDEALLTGESIPIAKDSTKVYTQEIPVGDRLNMAFSSSTVSKGRAQGIAVATGLSTEIGKIANSLQTKSTTIRKVTTESPTTFDYLRAIWGTVYDTVGWILGTNSGTPLKRKLSKLAVYLFFVAVLLAIIVMASQKFELTKEVAIYAVCVALSMIPSSLVVVLTITMAVGAKVMVKRNVIVRKLDSLENLGSVNAICSDKTGTLTQGEMIAKNVFIPGVGTFSVSNSNEPLDPTIGTIEFIQRSPTEINENDHNNWVPYDEFMAKEATDLKSFNNYMKWVHIATLANIATVFEDHGEDDSVEWKARGDPTEVAIQVLTTRVGYPRSKLIEGGNYQHLAEFPFDSTIKRMTSIYHNIETSKDEIFTKGAVERILGCCSKWTNPETGNLESVTPESEKYINENVDALSSKGLRVLAFAYKYPEHNRAESWAKIERAEVETELTFSGLIGIYDPPRPESYPSVKSCHRAGITVHMATGDHPSTARAIAQEVGILPHNLYHYSKEMTDIMVMTASQFDALSDDAIDKLPVLPLVIARCAPQTKVRLVDALHRRGQIVAMTGDGVNDSPSLKKSDIGIAMGKNGSDVAKDASDIVLSDDNFASILNAIEEGRRMGDNIQKFVLQLLSMNVGQAFFLMIGLVFQDANGMSVFPLSSVEVLWVIVITSCFPAMGLGLEKASVDIMEKPPKDAKENVFTWEILIDMIVYGLFVSICCMGPFVIEIYGYANSNLGYDCNQMDYGEMCGDVFKARSSSFAVMTWCALLLAWEVIDSRRSLFLMRPEADNLWTQWMKDLWSNQFLFWSVLIGFITIFPTVYIPVINDKVFLHKPPSAGWGYAVAFSCLFLVLAEIYKSFKRLYFRREITHNPEYDLEKNDAFSRYSSFSRNPTLLPEERYIH